jgi:uncharacterized membrane protein YeaQ/YmgE (transglycosylase-associated protein family)
MTGIGRVRDAVGKWKIGANRVARAAAKRSGAETYRPYLEGQSVQTCKQPAHTTGWYERCQTGHGWHSISGGAGMSILAWIVLGLIAGAIAKAIMPGNDPGGIIVTILIGIVGAFLGGFLGNMVAGSGLNGFSIWSIVLAVVGAILLLWI